VPGAAVEALLQDGLYHGAMRVELGPVALRYQGTVRLIDVDEDARAATFEARGSETGGPGTAAALIHTELTPNGAGTTVRAVTDLRVTGRAAEFGRGVMEEVAGAMLVPFAERLERLVADAHRSPAQPSPAARRRSDPAVEADAPVAALDVGHATGRPVLRRVAPAAVGGVLVAAAVWSRVKVRR
jgi:carbon monoxide dehydrogenase subunit G